MTYYIKFKMEEKSCGNCILLDDNGFCQIQRDEEGFLIEFINFNEQIKNCPLKICEE